MADKLNYSATGHSITDEELAVPAGAGDVTANLEHDTIMSDNLIIRTAAGGGGTLLTSPTDYELSDYDSLYEAYRELTFHNYQSTTVYVSYYTVGDYIDAADVNEKAIGAVSSTDNAIVRFDGTTGKTIQNSLVTIDDSGNINIPSGTKYKINGSDLSYMDVGAQASDATLTALAGLSTAANKMIYFTAADTATVTDLTSFARTILDDSDAATVRSTIDAAQTSHSHAASDITSGTLAVARGGTGIASYTIGNFIYASAATTLAQRTPAQVLSDISAMPLAGGTFTGNVNFADNIAQRPEIKDYAETVYAHGTTGGAKTIDLTNGNIHTITLNAATTFTFSNPPASGKAGSLTLIITQASTAVSVTWPASVEWVYGSAPDLSGDSTDYVLVFLTTDGGTTWRGWLSGSAFL